MDLDPEDIFRDDDEDRENEFYQSDSSKELVVYLVDASPKMFNPASKAEDQEETCFHIAVSCISQSLKTQIINISYDEVAICFFNTREKKNLQDLNGVFVFNVAEREYLDGPTARLIKEFSLIEDTFMSKIGSQYGIISDSRDNSLYNALWVAQALLRKGSAKTVDKRILLFTNEDDPFGSIKGATRTDMIRTTKQRAKDAQDLGISIELLPLCRSDDEFNVSLFYDDLIGLEGEYLKQFIPSAGEKLEDMKDQLRKKMFKKRKVRRITFSIVNGISIELNTYALIRPTLPGAITWLDSVTNLPLKTERSFICADTGALVQEPRKRFQPYKNENVNFSMEELSEIKRVSTGNLRLLGFKPLSCLKDYDNLRPSTFLFPSDEEIIGSTSIFIALHRSMLRLKRFAVAFYGSSTHPQMVAIVAQDEIATSSGQVEPPGMHMIYLPYSDDIRQIEELHTNVDSVIPRATDDQFKKATALLIRVDLKDFSVCQFANPALQRHYAVLEALALDDDVMPEIKDETVPDEEGMARSRNIVDDLRV
ncbi:ATP-dependent DNA helicase 2 subunit KU70 isoform X2 [Macadamia integrifolia]|uniref:ATP-dependent DNA helicase 2 subunit KU70 isoform X2 n=1 Tax=Macadamia integrifolia TaxID=60698 RepID=UPI001C4E5FF6|nr:ATP-dependent DNA helicase 2 subunit KU70 isoform X2 [Macadamia integrifolia]XP_042495808.1 ATP-dependent DNA helicase 2 subunit KU70 isoform X2 [Macadamia integrifolia]